MSRMVAFATALCWSRDEKVKARRKAVIISLRGRVFGLRLEET